MGISRAKVELKDVVRNYKPETYRPTHDEAIWTLKRMIEKLNKEIGAAGIKQAARLKEYYESPGEKARRKRRTAENQREKQRLKELFPSRRKKKEPNRAREE